MSFFYAIGQDAFLFLRRPDAGEKAAIAKARPAEYNTIIPCGCGGMADALL